MSKVQVNKPTETRAKEVPVEVKAKDLSPTAEELQAKADEIVDMIDDVLEKNAEAFVNAYVQRGGEVVFLCFAVEMIIRSLNGIIG